MVYVSGGNELLDPMKILKRLGITTGSVVADLGCGGAGHFVIPTAKLIGSKTNVFAVDILKSVLASVTSIGRLEGVNNIKSVWADLEQKQGVNIPAGKLDFAMVINMLFLSKQHEAVLQEAVRLLKSGGKMMVIDWKAQPTNFGPKSEDRVSPNEVKAIADRLSLKLIDEFEAGTYHFGLIFQK